MNLELYLLSIIDNLHNLFIAGMIIGIFCASCSVVVWIISIDSDVDNPSMFRKMAIRFCKFTAIAFSIAFLFSLVPTRDDIVKAYMIQEGAKLVTAKNADKAVEEFTKRLDKVIEHFTEIK